MESIELDLAYPRTRYEPPSLPDLSDLDVRRRLSPAALKAFFRMMDIWKVRDEDARALLGGISNGAFYEWKKDHSRTLDRDELRRISFLIGIFKALNILHSKGIADEWMQLPNKNRMFKGSTPLEYIVRGDLPALQMLRSLLDARRGGR